jgi:hypothetical protein
MFFPVAGRGFRMRDFESPRSAVATGKFAREFCENRKTRVLAAAQDDAETVETGLARGQTGGRLCRIKNLAAGTRGEIELGTVCGIDEIADVKILAAVCATAVILYFGFFTFFAEHETLLKELFAGVAGFAVLILMVVSFVFGLASYQRKKIYSFIPFLICLISLPSVFIGGIILGEIIRAAHFQKNLPRFTKVVHLIENGEITPSDGEVQLPEEFSDLAFNTYAHKSRDVQMVTFITDEAFPLWRDGYIYVSGDITNQTDFVKEWNLHNRINTNWFRISD